MTPALRPGGHPPSSRTPAPLASSAFPDSAETRLQLANFREQLRGFVPDPPRDFGPARTALKPDPALTLPPCDKPLSNPHSPQELGRRGPARGTPPPCRAGGARLPAIESPTSVNWPCSDSTAPSSKCASGSSGLSRKTAFKFQDRLVEFPEMSQRHAEPEVGALAACGRLLAPRETIRRLRDTGGLVLLLAEHEYSPGSSRRQADGLLHGGHGSSEIEFRFQQIAHVDQCVHVARIDAQHLEKMLHGLAVTLLCPAAPAARRARTAPPPNPD